MRLGMLSALNLDLDSWVAEPFSQLGCGSHWEVVLICILGGSNQLGARERPVLKKKRREQSKYDVGSKQEEQDERYLS